MHKIIIFGNSGSGKSTLAKKLNKAYNLVHLDLDLLAWQNTDPPQRMTLKKSAKSIKNFMEKHTSWVIEGCYSDLLSIVTEQSNYLIFMDLPTSLCIENAKNRPWEPHKYKSKKAQDANLAMLIDWISQYDSRDDTFSRQAHQKLYASYTREKQLIKENLKSLPI